LNLSIHNIAAPIVAILLFVALSVVSLLTTSLLPFVLFIAAGIAVAGAFFAFQKPWIMVFLIAAGSYMGSLFYFAEDFFLPVSLFQFFLFTGLTLYLLHLLYYQSFEIRYTGYELPVLLFLAFVFFSLIYSPDRETGLINGIRFLFLIIFTGYVFNVLSSSKYIVAIVSMLAGIAVLLAAFAVTETILNPQIAIQNLTEGSMRVQRASVGALYHDPNRFAAILFLPAAFTFSVINSQMELKYKMIGAFCFVILLAGLFSTFSRSGFLSFILIVLIIVGLFKNWKIFFLFSAAGLMVILAIPELRDALMINLERLFEVLFGRRDDSSGIRVMLGIAGIQMFIDSYMIGVGFEGFSERFTSYFTLQESIGVYEPHNITYTMMAELGLLGLFFYLFYLYVISYHAWQNVKLAESPLEKVIAVTLIASFAAYTLFYQFYGGALLDSNLVLIHALIFVVYYQYLNRETPFVLT